MKLSNEEKLRYARIIFNSQGRQKNQIDDLTVQQLQKIRSLYAQKISYQAVNGEIESFNQEGYGFVIRRPNIPNLFTSICCCCFPQENREYFDITTTIFLKRVFYPFVFWGNQFLKINNGKSEQYGLLWLLLTFSLIMGLAANLNIYFIKPSNFKFDQEVLVRAFGLLVVFKIAEPLIYSGVISCLGGFIQTNQSVMISSYSLVLYFIPTLFCMVPSLYWHVVMMVAGSFFRGVFLFRNYSTKLDSKLYIIFFVIVLIESIYIFVTLRTVFVEDAGYGFQQGFNTIFGIKPTITQDQSTVAGAKEQHQLFTTLRHFQN